MSKRWIKSLDVTLDDETGAILVKDVSAPAPAPGSGEGSSGGGSGPVVPTTMAGGTKTVASTATPEALVASATPCQKVWVGARCDANGVEQNTKPVFIGNSGGQNMPLMIANFEGFYLDIDDASKVYVKVGVNGEGIVYRVFA